MVEQQTHVPTRRPVQAQIRRQDVPYHDLYWSEARVLRWPD